MGRYNQSNRVYSLPKPVDFKEPKTLEEYREMSYRHRLWYKLSSPKDYEKFRKESEKQPCDWRYSE